MLWDGIHKLVVGLGRSHHVVPQLLVHIGVCLRSQLCRLARRLISIVEKALLRQVHKQMLENSFMMLNKTMQWVLVNVLVSVSVYGSAALLGGSLRL